MKTKKPRTRLQHLNSQMQWNVRFQAHDVRIYFPEATQTASRDIYHQTLRVNCEMERLRKMLLHEYRNLITVEKMLLAHGIKLGE